ncbi:hypothetical protein C8C83_0492 [Flavobacterium sp. 90]|nr:hypothetical protein C8C82_0787 [Flavobacterium sp. 81]TCK52685.1 hypothetical protein C8C83_0492 [Flavobacterium sp. 90]
MNKTNKKGCNTHPFLFYLNISNTVVVLIIKNKIS